MHRFFLSPTACQGEEVELRSCDVRHAHHVLRLEKGASIQILDGAGCLLTGELVFSGKHCVRARILSRAREDLPVQKLGLALPLLKPKAMDWALQKATELGVQDIWLIETHRCVSKWHADEIQAKRQRMNIALIESMKQCGSQWKPRLHGPLPFQGWLSGMDASWKLFYGDLRNSVCSVSIMEAVETCKASSICWCVGPEGDFTEGEATMLSAHPALSVHLGPLILRSETAVVCGLSILGQWLYLRRQTEA
ncbi:MAG: RsmE family RNA methyltransferase [Verrucomicrobiota bacterium]|nr:RsmE family RNA methyltransferase [Verrucomicrobiota bacterium]